VTARLKLVAQAGAVAVVAALLGLLAWKVATNGGTSVRKELRAGKHPKAPDFTLARLDGDGNLSLASLRGKAVVINFWASWCGPCKREAPRMEAAWRKYRSRGVVFVGVDYQDVRSFARRFAKRNGMTYPLVYDGRGKVLGRYGATGVPETMFIDRRGRLVGDIIAQAIDTNDDTDLLEDNIHRALRS
jgi:cytochrome c biogenesis protein CcmG, thiol:disulfide interchange protein DsbE